ncbi:hypothetical protein BWI93_05320 [Siphonobacter sp. BAB-5385]|uniref:hypothetical protein n=1 Tax=Siphonobacter sp. BAB-5385 TaxID=1864822 RepID=UPI000B9E7594|nr:hypothetical protein [Siphonobacter sp. BAB-5385]OZI09167.1 hypothetical protein BWI93_05320 [Siphonobacter sp. BAB-5385]
MIQITHTITKKVNGDSYEFPYLFWLELSHTEPKACKGKIIFELGDYKYREEFRIDGYKPNSGFDRRTTYLGVPCKERPAPGSVVQVKLKYEGQKQEEAVTVVDKYEDLSMY